MRILFVIDNFGSGGAQRQMVKLARGLRERGHEVEFFVYYPEYNHFASEVERACLPVHRVQKSGRFSVNVIKALRGQIRRGNYDVILSRLDTPNFYAEVACAGLKRPAVVIIEGSMYRSGKLPLMKQVLEHTHRLADYITVNSHHQRERMAHRFPWMRGKIKTIYNGVDLHEFSSSTSSSWVPDARLKFLAVGSIMPYKNAPVLIRALSIYRERYGNPPRVRWAGKEVRSEQAQRAAAEAKHLLDSLQLNDCWEWLGDRTDIPSLLSEHDALIHPSFVEGLPNVVCEALACGRPVIASNILDHPRLVQNGVSGFLFEWDDPHSLAARIREFHNLSPDERARMGAAARNYAEENLSLPLLVDSYERLFSSLLPTTEAQRARIIDVYPSAP